MAIAQVPPIATITRIEFYKIDQLAMDLLCCAIEYIDDDNMMHIIFNEDDHDLSAIDRQLAALKGFDSNWREKVVHPTFEPCNYVAFQA